MNIKQLVVLFRRSSSGGTGSSMRINQAFTENCEGRQNFVKVDFAYVKKDMISEIHSNTAVWDRQSSLRNLRYCVGHYDDVFRICTWSEMSSAWLARNSETDFWILFYSCHSRIQGTALLVKHLCTAHTLEGNPFKLL